MPNDLYATFRQLERPAAKAQEIEVFTALPIAGVGRWHLAKSAEGLPALIVAEDETREADWVYGVKLQNLRVQHRVLCRLAGGDSATEPARWSIVQCLSDETNIQQCFLRTIGSALVDSSVGVRARDLNVLIDRLVVLFRLMRKTGDTNNTRSMGGVICDLACQRPRKDDRGMAQPMARVLRLQSRDR